MSLSLTLCIVPLQIDEIFKKGHLNKGYAEWIASLPNILRDDGDYDYYEGEDIVELREDALKLKDFYSFSPSYYFYDEYSCISTLDYLLNQYIEDKGFSFEKSFLWKGGDRISDHFSGGQGIPIRIYDRDQIKKFNNLINSIEFPDLKGFYNFEKMKMEVYKLTSPDYMHLAEAAFKSVKSIFYQASVDENLLIFKNVD